MKKEDIIRKLTSRKFWMAVVGFVTGILVAFNISGEDIEKVTGIIMSGASLIAYIIAEGMVDAKETTNLTIQEGTITEDNP